MLDPVLLARLQFALTICFHFLFPPISIGLAWMLVVLEYKGWRGDADYDHITRVLGKILALNFAVGVATGIVMEFQFGTNWAAYSRFVGDIFGAPLAAEGVFAFFLESGFLGLYLFGRERVSRGVHWFSILMVAVGATLSAFWILVANSWQQTPTGYHLVTLPGGGQRAELTSFAAAVFNPSMWHRFFHTVDAALITGAFFVAGVAAWRLRNGVGGTPSRKALGTAVVAMLVFSVLELFPFGHEHARQVARTQPEKFAAMEGIVKTERGAPLTLFGVVKHRPHLDVGARIEIPHLLSYLAYSDMDAEVKGLADFPADQRPPLWLPFVSFHNMVILGQLFILMGLVGAWLRWKGTLHRSRRYLKALLIFMPLPVIACQFGWIAAEVGRQPWIVYRLLRTDEAISVTVPAGNVLFSLVVFLLIYILLGWLYLFLLRREMAHAPEAGAGEVSA